MHLTTTPHPNEVLNLFAQQNIAFALPVAYYMAVRRGPDSLMARRLPASEIVPILQVAIRAYSHCVRWSSKKPII